MTDKYATCRVRVRVARSDHEDDDLVSINEFCNCSDEVRKQWLQRIIEVWLSHRDDSQVGIRSWDLILCPDGTIESLPVPLLEGEGCGTYPAHYRIPPTSIECLQREDQVKRQESFAFGSLLYEIGSGKKPFDWLNSEEVQERYSNADFPDDVKSLPAPFFVTILSLWSLEFANTCNLPRSPPQGFTARARSYIKAHPFRSAFQLTGVLISTAALATPAIIGAVGFSALGPVAGSAAAGWQASLGIVQSGSLSAWCQSAAMGGAAMNGVITAGAAGGGVAALAAAAGAAGHTGIVNVDELMKKFREVYRKGNPKELRAQNAIE